ncbi:MAG: nitroreductase family protein [Candidatus Kapabacteria bacterium]|nr:nitroreductase family protein [Candidatus Kapabacteria bacterium]
MIIKRAVTSEPINEVIKNRWSPRAFDRNRRVSREMLVSICEAARWAPSCFNDQPYRYIVWDYHHNKSAFDRAFNCLGEWNQKWVQTAPVLFVALADSIFRKTGKDNRWAQYDTGAASMNICLQATSLGLMAHQMGGFEGDKLKKEFGIDQRFTPMAMIAVGYQAEIEVLDESYHKDELKARERIPLGRNFFDSEWEVPILKDFA